MALPESPITRGEVFLNAVANSDASGLPTPVTRREKYLSAIAEGDSSGIPDAPHTREEQYLDYIAKNGGGGSGDEPKLPDEYQRVQYLDFTPDAGFLVTIPNDASWEVVCSSDTTNSAHGIFGYRASSTSNSDFDFVIGNRNSVQSLYLYVRGTTGVDLLHDPDVPVEVGVKMTFRAVLHLGRDKAFIGRYSEKSGEYYGWDGKLFGIKGHNPLTQELTANFVPCYKKADNTIGIYDLVGKVFYGTLTASGSGAVAKGPDAN